MQTCGSSMVKLSWMSLRDEHGFQVLLTGSHSLILAVYSTILFMVYKSGSTEDAFTEARFCEISLMRRTLVSWKTQAESSRTSWALLYSF